jgi:hypothetical protein
LLLAVLKGRDRGPLDAPKDGCFWNANIPCWNCAIVGKSPSSTVRFAASADVVSFGPAFYVPQIARYGGIKLEIHNSRVVSRPEVTFQIMSVIKRSKSPGRERGDRSFKLSGLGITVDVAFFPTLTRTCKIEKSS